MKRRTFIRSTLGAAAALTVPGGKGLAALYRPVEGAAPDVPAITGDGREITLRGRDIAELAGRLQGRILLSGDEGYEEARLLRNPSFDRRPALIAQVTGAADVRTAVDFAREHDGLLLAVKCGGHSFSGTSTCDKGMMIDLSPFRSVRVDPAGRRAWVTGGSLLGQVDHEAAAYGLATPLGTVSHTGVGGLVTGGGFGRLQRRFGLSIDNLTAVDVVTADGQLRHASEDENPDLFWGVRGGGGNFGVVTSFEFRLHPIERRMLAGRVGFPLSRAREVLSLYAEYAPEAPDELLLDFGMFAPPGGEEGMVGFMICYSGPESGGERALAPIRSLGTPVVDTVEAMDYVSAQRSGDETDPRARATYLRTGFVPRMPEGLITAIVEGFEPHPVRGTGIGTVHCGGAIGRVAPAATAFPQRDAQAMLLGSANWPAGSDGAEHMEWVRQYWRALDPYTHGFYVNDMDPDATARAIQENYSHNHTRLVEVKNRYDPLNLFRLNANVQPTV